MDEKVEFLKKLSKMDNPNQLSGKILLFINDIVIIEDLAERLGITVHSDLCPMRVGDSNRWTYLIRLEVTIDDKPD